MPLPWIVLNEVHGLGPVTINRLLTRYGSPEEILKQSSSELEKSGIVSPRIADALKSSRVHARAELILKRVEESGAKVVTLEDRRYPSVLREIFAPPPILFTRGSSAGFQKTGVGVVGTRRPTRYGEKAAETVTSELTRNGLLLDVRAQLVRGPHEQRDPRGRREGTRPRVTAGGRIRWASSVSGAEVGSKPRRP